jgi:hypothetical protein
LLISARSVLLKFDQIMLQVGSRQVISEAFSYPTSSRLAFEFISLIRINALVAKSLGGTAQAPVLGNRAWDHRCGSELGPELRSELGSEL